MKRCAMFFVLALTSLFLGCGQQHSYESKSVVFQEGKWLVKKMEVRQISGDDPTWEITLTIWNPKTKKEKTALATMDSMDMSFILMDAHQDVLRRAHRDKRVY